MSNRKEEIEKKIEGFGYLKTFTMGVINLAENDITVGSVLVDADKDITNDDMLISLLSLVEMYAEATGTDSDFVVGQLYEILHDSKPKIMVADDKGTEELKNDIQNALQNRF